MEHQSLIFKPKLAEADSTPIATPYPLVHDPADANKIAHYLLRWVNTRNEAGPWSETLSATITA